MNRDGRSDGVVAFSADVKGAHELCRLRTSEHGLVLFECIGILCYYLVCHFGGAWSSYRWARAGGALHRVLRLLLWDPHPGWLYVDDWLWRLPANIGWRRRGADSADSYESLGEYEDSTCSAIIP